MRLAPAVQAAMAAGLRFDEGGEYIRRMDCFLEGGLRHGRISGEAGIAASLTWRGSLGWHFTEQVMINLGMEGYSHERANPDRIWPKPPAGDAKNHKTRFRIIPGCRRSFQAFSGRAR